MSYAQIYHTRKALMQSGITPAHYQEGKLVNTLTPLVTALGGRILDATDCTITVRINNTCSYSATTFGALIGGLVGHDGTVSTVISASTVHIDFNGGC